MPYIIEVVQAGRTVEVMKYYSSRYGKKGIKRGERKALTKEEQIKVNKRAAEKKLRRLINENFQEGDTHLVLDYRKIGRKKYKAFREVYERLTRPEKQTYTDAELDEMINTIVLVYDNQFTFEEANESLEDVSEIIFNFGLINANILKKLKDEAAGAKKNLSSQV